ncbi:MAG TPA: hypothetical protein VF757_10350 [Sphingomicrobium sp.]
MSIGRPVIALDCRSFGRGRAWLPSERDAGSRIGDDLKLFATTFLAGFIFVSLLIG